MKINAVVIRGEVSETNKQNCIDYKMQHPDFPKIKIVGENFWSSKDSGRISLRYTVCSL